MPAAQLAIDTASDQVAMLLLDPEGGDRSGLTASVRWGLHHVDMVRGQEAVAADPRAAGAAILALGVIFSSLAVQSGHAYLDKKTGRAISPHLEGTATVNAYTVVGHLLYTGRDDLEQLREAWS